MMKTDNPLTAILDEEIDNIEDLDAKHQLVKELNSYFSNKANQLQSQMDIHQKNVNNVNCQTVNIEDAWQDEDKYKKVTRSSYSSNNLKNIISILNFTLSLYRSVDFIRKPVYGLINAIYLGTSIAISLCTFLIFL